MQTTLADQSKKNLNQQNLYNNLELRKKSTKDEFEKWERINNTEIYFFTTLVYKKKEFLNEISILPRQFYVSTYTYTSTWTDK